MKQILLFSLFASTCSFAQIGSFDPTFNDDSYFQIQNWSSIGRIIPLTNETCLNISNSGYDVPMTLGKESALIKFLANNPSGSASAQNQINPNLPDTLSGFRDFTKDSDGRIVVVGYRHFDAPAYDKIFVGRYNADGSIDNTFNGSSFLEIDYSSSFMSADVFKVLVLSSGKILAVGKRANSTNILVRINANGTLDNTYGTNGIYNWNFMGGSYSKIHDAIELSTGKILVAGSENDPTNNNIQTAFVVRLNSDGTIDNTFGVSGVSRVFLGQSGKTSLITSIALTSNGSIIVGGLGFWTGQQSWDVSRGALAKLDADGVVDAAFGTQVIPSDYSGINKILVGSNDDIIAGGYISTAGIRSTLFAFMSDEGVFDTSFDADGMITNSNTPNPQILDFAFQPDGKIIYVQSFYTSNFDNGMYVGRMLMGTGTNDLEETSLNQMAVYPNPSNGTTTISVTKPTQISVKTINGTEILTTTIENQKMIDLSEFAAGVYFINTAEGQTIKVIKE